MNELKLKLLNNEFISIWKSFCELHQQLFEYTCEEYQQLLASDIDRLEQVIKEKSEVIEKINQTDTLRLERIEEAKALFGLNNVSHVQEIIQKFNEIDQTSTLSKYNSLLVEIVENIREQNKKNQVYLNKAIYSLQELKNTFSGDKSYNTYNKHGKSSIHR